MVSADLAPRARANGWNELPPLAKQRLACPDAGLVPPIRSQAVVGKPPMRARHEAVAVAAGVGAGLLRVLRPQPSSCWMTAIMRTAITRTRQASWSKKAPHSRLMQVSSLHTHTLHTPF